MTDLVVLRSEETAEFWEARIRPHLAGAVSNIMAAGREFTEAKAAVRHGEWTRLCDVLRVSDETARQFMRVAEHPAFQNPNTFGFLPPSWGTLYQLSRLPAPQLEAAIEAGEVTPTLERKAARQLVAKYLILDAEPVDAETLPAAPPVAGIYTTIVADPPWQYDNRATRAAAADHYPTLDIDQLRALDVDGRSVADCAAPNAHLYLWTTNSFLPRSFEVMEAWGFEYKTTLVWVKPQMGIGNYFRSSHEFVLFGLRGRLPVKDSNQMSWFEAPRGRHSRKPDCFYDLVETVSPGPYLEMFARTDLLGPRPGWTPWGNEA